MLETQVSTYILRFNVVLFRDHTNGYCFTVGGAFRKIYSWCSLYLVDWCMYLYIYLEKERAYSEQEVIICKSSKQLDTYLDINITFVVSYSIAVDLYAANHMQLLYTNHSKRGQTNIFVWLFQSLAVSGSVTQLHNPN